MGIYARLAATYQLITGQAPARAAHAVAAALCTHRRSCAPTSCRWRAAWPSMVARLLVQWRRAGAVDPAGRNLRLPPGDRGPAAELRCACPRGGRAAARGRRRSGLCRADGRAARDAAAPGAVWRAAAAISFRAVPAETQSELAIARAAAAAHGRYGAACDHHLHHLQVRERVGHAGSEPAAEGGRPLPRRGSGRRGHHGGAAVRDHRRSGTRAADHGRVAGAA